MKPKWMICSIASVASVLCAPCTSSRAALAPALSLSFEESAVVVEGASPGGEIVWFSIASESADYSSTTVPRSAVSTTDILGSATFEVEGTVPPHSIWAAVDATTGVLALATPGGYPLREFAIEAGAIRSDRSGKVSLLSTSRTDLHLLLVRPGTGAWIGRFSEGAADDSDGAADGVLTSSLSNLRALGDTRQLPDEFRAGDLVVAVDPINMEVTTIRLQD